MKEASENHADILLLPECFITGYDLPMSYEKSIADNDIRIAKICENAKKYKIGVVLTAFTKGNKQPQNSAFVINKSGDILMKYSKVHTCDFADERNLYAWILLYLSDESPVGITSIHLATCATMNS